MTNNTNMLFDFFNQEWSSWFLWKNWTSPTIVFLAGKHYQLYPP